MTCPTDRPFTFPVADTVKVSYVPREAARDFSAGFDVCIAAGSNEICDLTELHDDVWLRTSEAYGIISNK